VFADIDEIRDVGLVSLHQSVRDMFTYLLEQQGFERIRFCRRLKFGERSDLRNGSEREDGQAQDGIQRQNVLFLQPDVQDDF